MLIKWFAKHDVPLNERGRNIFNTIEFLVGLALFILVIGIAGGIEVGTIKLPWGL